MYFSDYSKEHQLKRQIKEFNESALRKIASDSYTSFDYFLDDFDINRIPIDERIKAYVDYRRFYNGRIENRLWNRTIDESKLSESDELEIFIEPDGTKIETMNVASVRQLQSNLKSYGVIGEWQFQFYNPYGVQIPVYELPIYLQGEISVVLANIANNFKIIESRMAECGYFVSKKVATIDEYGKRWIMVAFNPIKQDSIKTFLKRNVQMIHHCSSLSNHDSIIKDGLRIDKSHNENITYPPRLFFYCGTYPFSMSKDKNYIETMKDILDVRHQGTRCICYHIPTSSIPDNVDFFMDPNTGNSCYTTDSIPPELLTNFNEFELP